MYFIYILHALITLCTALLPLLIAWIGDVEPYGVEYHPLRFGSQGSRHLLLPRQRPRILRFASSFSFPQRPSHHAVHHSSGQCRPRSQAHRLGGPSHLKHLTHFPVALHVPDVIPLPWHHEREHRHLPAEPRREASRSVRAAACGQCFRNSLHVLPAIEINGGPARCPFTPSRSTCPVSPD